MILAPCVSLLRTSDMVKFLQLGIATAYCLTIVTAKSKASAEMTWRQMQYRQRVTRSFLICFTCLLANCQSWNNFWTNPTLAYPATVYAFQLDIPISMVLAKTTGGVTSCSATPTLPAGLSLDSTCSIRARLRERHKRP